MHRIVWAGADYRKVCRYRGGNGLFTARTDNLHIHTVAVPHWFGVVEMQSPVRCATAGWMMVRLKRAVTRRAVVNIVVVWYGNLGCRWGMGARRMIQANCMSDSLPSSRNAQMIRGRTSL
jgi:hypothetical protein